MSYLFFVDLFLDFVQDLRLFPELAGLLSAGLVAVAGFWGCDFGAGFSEVFLAGFLAGFGLLAAEDVLGLAGAGLLACRTSCSGTFTVMVLEPASRRLVIAS